jgi:hypothetical protein
MRVEAVGDLAEEVARGLAEVAAEVAFAPAPKAAAAASVSRRLCVPNVIVWSLVMRAV